MQQESTIAGVLDFNVEDADEISGNGISSGYQEKQLGKKGYRKTHIWWYLKGTKFGVA